MVKGLLLIGRPGRPVCQSRGCRGPAAGGAGHRAVGGLLHLDFRGRNGRRISLLHPRVDRSTSTTRARFKREVVAEIFKVVSPEASYAAHRGLTAEIVDASGIFSTRGGTTSDDLVRGTIGGTPFEAAEVKRSYTTGGKNSTTHVVFNGLFFHLDFNKALKGLTIVQPEGSVPCELGPRDGLTQVELESPEFESKFAVYAVGRGRGAIHSHAVDDGAHPRASGAGRQADLPRLQSQPRLSGRALRPSAVRAEHRLDHLARGDRGDGRALRHGGVRRSGAGPQHENLDEGGRRRRCWNGPTRGRKARSTRRSRRVAR